MKRVRSCPTFPADTLGPIPTSSSTLQLPSSQAHSSQQQHQDGEGEDGERASAPENGRDYCHAWLKYGFCPASYLCKGIESDTTKSSRGSSDSQSSGSLSKEEREEGDYDDGNLYRSSSFDR